MNYQKIIKQVEKTVRQRLWEEKSGHDYWHCYRVVKTALAIGKKENGDLVVLELAAWLHDIEVTKSREKHEELSAKLAQKYLKQLGLEKEIIEKVANCIRKHRFSKKIKAETLEEKIIQDADKLDALGAVGIARAFYGGSKYGEVFHTPSVKPNQKYYFQTGHSTSVVNHFYEKLFHLKDLLHTQTAKKIAKDREKVMKEFLKRFYLEWEGKK